MMTLFRRVMRDPLFRNYVTQRRRIFFAFVIALLALCGAMTNGYAACTTDAAAAQRAGTFIGNTSSLLNGPNGPRGLADVTNDVRDFVAADPQALAAIIAILKGNGVSSDQQKAIGAGLGLAAGICLRPDPTFAAEIQTELAGTDSADAKGQYAAITGNNPIGSVAAGGAGGGAGSAGSVGGQTTPAGTPAGGGGSFQAFTSNSVSNNPTNFFTSSVSGTGSTVTPGGTTTTTNVTNITCTVSKNC